MTATELKQFVSSVVDRFVDARGRVATLESANATLTAQNAALTQQLADAETQAAGAITSADVDQVIAALTPVNDGLLQLAAG